MKSLFLIFFCLAMFFAHNVRADSIEPLNKEFRLAFGPADFINKLRVNVEFTGRPKNKSFGIVTSYFYKTGLYFRPLVKFKGVLIEPYIRWYGKESGSGFYFQLKLTTGFMKYVDYISYYSESFPTGSFATIGAAYAYGYQLRFGRNKKLSADFSLGLRYATSIRDNNVSSVWLAEGPGSIFNPMLLLGYRIHRKNEGS